MATQSYIAERETALIAAQAIVGELAEAYTLECTTNDGTPYAENRSEWRTTAHAASHLITLLEAYIRKTSRA